MTTNNDRYELRISNDSDWGLATEFSFGVPIDGTVDPSGEYPRKDYFFGSSISQAARGVKINNLAFGGSYYDINLDIPPQIPSEFPFSQANETPSGHSIEVDDTPGGERILIKHRTGSGIELKPDGSIIISSGDRKIEVVKGDSKVIVSGSGDMIYEGNLNMNVSGDYNLRVGGKYDVIVGGDYKQDIVGSKRSYVGQTRSDVTRQSKDTKTYGPTLDLRLGSHRDVTKGRIEQIVQGGINQYVGGLIDISVQNNINIATENYALITNNVAISAKDGLIGGVDVNHYGRVFSGPDSDGAKGGGVTYYGSLVGRAAEAWTSKYSLYADESYEAHISNYATIADYADESGKTKSQSYPENSTGSTPSDKYPTTIDGATVKDGSKNLNKDPAFYYGVGHNKVGEDSSGIVWKVQLTDSERKELMPGQIDSSGRGDLPEGATTQWIMLERTTNGIKKVSVDPNDSLADKIGKINYKDYFTHDPSMSEVRSKLRSFNLYSPTADQSRCIQELLRKGRLGQNYRSPAPGTLVDSLTRSETVRRYGRKTLGNPNENRSKGFRYSQPANAGTKYVSRDPRFNVRNNDYRKFDAGTHLTKTVTVGRFTGSAGNANSFNRFPDELERSRALGNLQFLAQIIEQVESQQEFSDCNLVVSEGLYIPSSKQENDEIDAAGTSQSTNFAKWNYWKRDGRAMVLQMIGSDGLLDWDQTWNLAVWLRDHVDYDKLAIDYDTFNYDGSTTIQVILTIPYTYNQTTITPEYRVSTWYNGKRQASSSLIKLENPYEEEDLVIEPTSPPEPAPYGVTVTSVTWSSTFDGENSWSGESLNRSNNTTGTLLIEFSEAKSVTISATISSEPDWDYGLIKVNGEDQVGQRDFSGTSEGDPYFQTFDESFDNVTTIEFSYEKDGSLSQGDDKMSTQVTWQ